MAREEKQQLDDSSPRVLEHLEAIPQVMVLVFDPGLTHSVWQDFNHRCRTVGSLLKCLRREIKAGRFVGYRFITIRKTVYGLD